MSVWVYNSTNGQLSRDGTLIAVAYSGHGPGVNNPALQNDPNIGPIPQGQWEIGPAGEHPGKGKIVMALTPTATTDTFGRGGFLIHGDSIEHPGAEEASHGCIILAKAVREVIATSGDNQLTVV